MKSARFSFKPPKTVLRTILCKKPLSAIPCQQKKAQFNNPVEINLQEFNFKT